jgi:hypothetical protein
MATSAGQAAGTVGRLNRRAALAFVAGGSLFALGAVFAQTGAVGLATVNVTYLVGGFFFSLGGYTAIRLAVAGTDPAAEPLPPGWWHLDPRRLAWTSAWVLFVGTLFFAVSLVAAFAQGLTPRQSNGWIWLPDITGCVCFLVSGHLAMLDVGGGRVVVRPHEVGWWNVAINQLGSVLFFLAGLGAFVRPATSAAVNVGLVNWGTFAGAVCFAAAGVVQAFETPG